MVQTELTVNSLGDAVKDKVRKAMMDAIPDEALQALIKNEFDKFFLAQPGLYHNDPGKPSSFSLMVRSEVELAMKEKIKSVILQKTSDVLLSYDHDGGKMVGELVEAMAPAAMAGVMKHIAGQCINNLRNGNIF
jgi:hypothetical protein